MPQVPPYPVPTEATAEKGEVMLDGPSGLALSLTPDAAAKSAVVIARAAKQARAQAASQRAPAVKPDTETR